MSADTHLVLYVTGSKIRVAKLIGKDEKIYELEWDGTDPTQVFAYIKKTYKASELKIIIGYEFSYVVCFEVGSDKINRVGILKAASQVVPEDLADYDCFWNVFAQNSETKTAAVQLVAVVPKLLNALAYAAKKNKVTITHISPIELVLAQVTQADDSPKLIVWSGIEKVALIAYKGNVYVSEDVTYRTDKKITELVSFAHQTYNLKISTAIVDWQKKDAQEVNKEPVFSAQWKIILKELNVVQQMHEHEVGVVEENALHIAVPQDPIPPAPESESETVDEPIPITAGSDGEAEEIVESGDDSLVINPHKQESTPESVVLDEEQPEMRSDTKTSLLNKKTFLIIGAVFLLTVFIIGAFTIFKNSTQKPIASPTPAPSASPEPSPTPDVSALKVRVLNGSGVTGAAKAVGEVLETQKFQTVETGNASSSDYTETEIQMKASVPEAVYEQITKALHEYSVKKGEELVSSAAFDIVIILGSEKK